jgi:hypothetical protein
VLFADDQRVEHARGRVERVDGRIDALFGDRADSTVVASKWANEVAGAGSVKSSAGT